MLHFALSQYPVQEYRYIASCNIKIQEHFHFLNAHNFYERAIYDPDNTVMLFHI